MRIHEHEMISWWLVEKVNQIQSLSFKKYSKLSVLELVFVSVCFTGAIWINNLIKIRK